MGPVRITNTAEGPKVTFHEIQFPKAKEEIEKLVIDNFDQNLSPSTRRQFDIIDFSQNNQQNDLDCTVRSERGNWLMDLVEFIPVKSFKGGHEAAPHIYTVGEMADRMLDQIRAKSDKYAGLNAPWLLMYATTWQFSPDDSVLAVVRRSLLATPPALGRIFYLYMMHADVGMVSQIYPVDAHSAIQLMAMDVSRLRRNEIIKIDNRRGRLVAKTTKQE
jgi:hypothetical protein